jgi:superfamily II DNA helicase RecQ
MPDLEVVRTSNRPRTVYSVVIVPAGRNVENFFVNWVKEATEKWRSDKKGLIYCHDVVKLQSLAGQLCCGMYYSKLEKKEEHLRNWMEGEGRLLCVWGFECWNESPEFAIGAPLW